ncbi:MAG TPA: hypothetical protein VNX21_04505 [Candidatus Thermoplasmatota archaeon]|nr:hypothetical protein [Candidatus Thermoplasmatota archaeon]
MRTLATAACLLLLAFGPALAPAETTCVDLAPVATTGGALAAAACAETTDAGGVAAHGTLASEACVGPACARTAGTVLATLDPRSGADVTARPVVCVAGDEVASACVQSPEERPTVLETAYISIRIEGGTQGVAPTVTIVDGTSNGAFTPTVEACVSSPYSPNAAFVVTCTPLHAPPNGATDWACPNMILQANAGAGGSVNGKVACDPQGPFLTTGDLTGPNAGLQVSADLGIVTSIVCRADPVAGQAGPRAVYDVLCWEPGVPGVSVNAG